MPNSPTMVPVLQLQDLAALEAAGKHLREQGFESRITPFADLPEAARRKWMTPEQGGYLFYLDPDNRYDDAMGLLGAFFGCTD